ncbi:hypothetical protein K456DRAFT_38420 [Colletotrichum gloeosporioides 23]|nr:hypothetical protein K456DRAFT_38420 [Colletotrichum gloeosporioides 23]
MTPSCPCAIFKRQIVAGQTHLKQAERGLCQHLATWQRTNGRAIPMKRRAEGEESGCLQQQVPVTKERDANVSVIGQPSRPSGQNRREQAQKTGEKNGDAVVGLTASQ